MKSILVKLFVPDYQNSDHPKVRIRYGKLASVFGIISNGIISIIKIVFGAFFGFMSFIADGLNNLSDAFSSIVSFIGFKMSSKPADKKHPYGHARMEALSGLVVASLIVALGIELLFRAIEEMFEKKEMSLSNEHFLLACLLLLFTIFVKIYQCLFYRNIAKTIHSLSLKASSFDAFADVLASISVLLGLILSFSLKINLDSYFAAGIGLFIFISGIKLLIEEASPLLGQKPSEKQIDMIFNLVKSFPEVLSLHDLYLHSYGDEKVYASLHIGMDSSLTLTKAHDIVDQIEKKCQKDLHILLVVHIDPVQKENEKFKAIEEEIKEILSSFSFPLPYHDFHIKKGPTYFDISFDLVLPDQKEGEEQIILQTIQKKAKEYSPYYRLFIQIDSKSSDLLFGKDEK